MGAVAAAAYVVPMLDEPDVCGAAAGRHASRSICCRCSPASRSWCSGAPGRSSWCGGARKPWPCCAIPTCSANWPIRTPISSSSRPMPGTRSDRSRPRSRCWWASAPIWAAPRNSIRSRCQRAAAGLARRLPLPLPRLEIRSGGPRVQGFSGALQSAGAAPSFRRRQDHPHRGKSPGRQIRFQHHPAGLNGCAMNGAILHTAFDVIAWAAAALSLYWVTRRRDGNSRRCRRATGATSRCCCSAPGSAPWCWAPPICG